MYIQKLATRENPNSQADISSAHVIKLGLDGKFKFFVLITSLISPIFISQQNKSPINKIICKYWVFVGCGHKCSEEVLRVTLVASHNQQISQTTCASDISQRMRSEAKGLSVQHEMIFLVGCSKVERERERERHGVERGGGLESSKCLGLFFCWLLRSAVPLSPNDWPLWYLVDKMVVFAVYVVE